MQRLMITTGPTISRELAIAAGRVTGRVQAGDEEPGGPIGREMEKSMRRGHSLRSNFFPSLYWRGTRSVSWRDHRGSWSHALDAGKLACWERRLCLRRRPVLRQVTHHDGPKGIAFSTSRAHGHGHGQPRSRTRRSCGVCQLLVASETHCAVAYSTAFSVSVTLQQLIQPGRRCRKNFWRVGAGDS